MFLLLSLWTWKLTAAYKRDLSVPFHFSLCLFSSIFSNPQRIDGFCKGVSSAPCALGSKKHGCVSLKVFPGKYKSEFRKGALFFHLHQNSLYLIILLCIVAARAAWCCSYSWLAVFSSAFLVTSNTRAQSVISGDPKHTQRYRQWGHFSAAQWKQSRGMFLFLSLNSNMVWFQV